MTNETSYAPIKYVCNGVSVDFAFPWKIFEEKDLIVQAQGESGLLRELTLGVDYSVEFDEVGGNVKLNQTYAEGDLVVISRNVSDYQSKSYSTSSGFQSSEIEDSFDRVSCNLQEMEYNIENFKEVFSQTVNQEIDTLEGVIEENKQEVLVIQERFEDEVNTKIQEVSEAAGKINALEQAVLDAQTSADNAQASANEAQAQKEELAAQGEQLIEDVSKEIARVEDAIEELDKNIDKVINHVSFNLFDTKISDHILQGNEAKGWALQGTYVTEESYPDFYNRCLEEKNSAIVNEIILADSTLTIFVNNNGHQFFNIADKDTIDSFYNTCGIADFYGIDEENQRIFLPRNKYFHQLTDDVSKVNEMMEAGLPNIEGTGHMLNGGTGCFETGSIWNYIRGGDAAAYQCKNVAFDASNSSSIYGNSDTVQPPASLKLLYYCVGNTEVTQAITNVTEVTTSENDTIPLFTGMYFDFKPNNVSWLKAGVQQNSAGVYKTCYDALVQIVNGANNYVLKAINKADIVSGVDYSEYWILDQDNLTFRTPIRTSERVLIETKVATDDDPTWYNLYSDGWCEQGGSTYGQSLSTANTINLLKPFKDINYTVDISFNMPSSNTGGYSVGYDAKTVNSFVVRGSSAGTNESNTFDWQANGYVSTTSNVNSNLYFKVANAVQNLELLNAGEVLEAVANKISRQDCLAYIVETYQNGSSWYRIYSDGWCEQGGIVATNIGTSGTIALLKEYANTNYTVVSNTGNNAANNFFNLAAFQKTTTSIPWYKSATGIQGDWQASGYIA